MDLLWRGIPTIEGLDLRGIAKNDLPGCVEDVNGFPCLTFPSFDVSAFAPLAKCSLIKQSE